MQTVFSFIGTTAVGKTSTVLAAARRVVQETEVAGVVLLSADSRQVYQGSEVLTGADIPDDFKRNQVAQIAGKNYFECENIILCGVSCCAVSEEWSVAHFQEYAQTVLEWAEARQYLVCVIGGTGLYHEQLLQTDAALHIPPDEKLRAWAANRSVIELQERLEMLDQSVLASLNNSDKHNPTRLVRAIERVQHRKNITERSNTSAVTEQIPHNREQQVREYTQQFIGFTRPDEVIRDAIIVRVQDRFATGAVAEVAALRTQAEMTRQVQTTLGFAEISQYLDGTLTAEACQELWALHEWQYAKRQKTWWQRYSAITWYSTMPEELTITLEEVVQLLRTAK